MFNAYLTTEESAYEKCNQQHRGSRGGHISKSGQPNVISEQVLSACFTYYMWNEDRSAYIVVAKLEGAETAMATQKASSSADIYVYPNNAQSTEQQGRDRYECYLWAVEQSAYDPVAGEADATKASDDQRALAACLEGRGYTVSRERVAPTPLH